MTTTEAKPKNIAVVDAIEGTHLFTNDQGTLLALVPGIQILHDKEMQESFESSGRGMLMSADEFCAQPIVTAQAQLKRGLTVEARDLLLAETGLKVGLRKEIARYA